MFVCVFMYLHMCIRTYLHTYSGTYCCFSLKIMNEVNYSTYICIELTINYYTYTTVIHFSIIYDILYY